MGVRADEQLARGLHRLPASQDRERRRAATHPHRARSWLRAAERGMTNPAAAVQRGLSGVDKRWGALPLRTRLTMAAALATTLAIVAVTAVAYIAVRHELRGQIDTQLRRQVDEVRVDQVLSPT